MCYSFISSAFENMHLISAIEMYSLILIWFYLFYFYVSIFIEYVIFYKLCNEVDNLFYISLTRYHATKAMQLITLFIYVSFIQFIHLYISVFWICYIWYTKWWNG